MINHWDSGFLDLAEYWGSKKSKDPSTKVGCVIVRPDRTVASMGYNGFPRGVNDSHERLFHRPTKYLMVVHAEANAVVTAREPLHGYTCYTWPFPPCSQCAALLIQAGIKRVVAPAIPPELAERWDDSLSATAQMFIEAGVTLEIAP